MYRNYSSKEETIYVGVRERVLLPAYIDAENILFEDIANENIDWKYVRKVDCK